MTGEATQAQVDTQNQIPAGDMDDDLTHPVLSGHPSMGEDATGPTVGEGEGEGGEGTGEGEAEGAQHESLKPPEREEVKTEPEGTQLKYKTHEEAERAYTEAERRMHEATTKAAQEAEAREALQRELDELKAKGAEEKPSPPVSQEERKAKLLAVAKAANRKALDKIGDLDRTDADYADQVAEAWAEANAEALLESGISTSSLSEEEISRIVKKQVAAERKEAQAEADRDTASRVWDKALTMAEKSGLDMQDKLSADYILFDTFARQLPKEMEAEPLEKQVGWVVGQVRSRVGQAVQTDKQREEAARRAQNNNAILDRGTLRPKVTTQKATPGNLDDDFETARRQRTL